MLRRSRTVIVWLPAGVISGGPSLSIRTSAILVDALSAENEFVLRVDEKRR
jgi:hypothetical protein